MRRALLAGLGLVLGTTLAFLAFVVGAGALMLARAVLRLLGIR